MHNDLCKGREVSAGEALPARKAELEHTVNRDMQESEAAFRRRRSMDSLEAVSKQQAL